MPSGKKGCLTMKKKLLCLLLAVVLIMQCLPPALSFADETSGETPAPATEVAAAPGQTDEPQTGGETAAPVGEAMPSEGTAPAETGSETPAEGKGDATTAPTEGTDETTPASSEGTGDATTAPTEGTGDATTTAPTEGTGDATTTAPTEGTGETTPAPSEGADGEEPSTEPVEGTGEKATGVGLRAMPAAAPTADGEGDPAAEGEPAEGGEGEPGGESEAVEIPATYGEPDGKVHEDETTGLSNLPEQWKVLVDENGVYHLTYMIPEGMSEEHIYIDLEEAKAACYSVGGISSAKTLQPGDTRVFQIWIQSHSGHTYKYTEGSFSLTTPDQDPSLAPEDPEAQVTGFDGQVLEEDYMGPFGGLNVSQCAPPIAQYLKQMFPNLTDRDLAYFRLGTWETNKFRTTVMEQYGTDDFSAAVEQLILDYYSEKDGKTYESYEQLFGESETALQEVYEESRTCPAYREIKGAPLSISPAQNYDNMYKKVLRFVYGDEDVDAAVENGVSRLQFTSKIVYTDVTDYDDGTVYPFCLPANQLENASDKSHVQSFLTRYGMPEDTLVVVDASGRPQLIYDYYPIIGLKLTDDPDDDTIATGANAEQYKSTVVTTQIEYADAKWHQSPYAFVVNGTVAQYMDHDSDTWKRAEAYFQQLLGDGINAEEATWEAFKMAFNMDALQAGNSFQGTSWSWHNTFELERIDGVLEVSKVGDSGSLITSDEATFNLWYYDEKAKYVYGTETVTSSDGNSTTREGFMESTRTDVDFGVKTKGGKLRVEYSLLEGLVYFLQETMAPEGYELDDTICIIADTEAEGETAFTEHVLTDSEYSGFTGDHVYAGKMDSETQDTAPLTVEVRNKELIDIPVTKTWSDADNQDGIRPGSVTVHLFADGKDTGKSLTLSARGEWKGEFTGLYRYTDEGVEIVYTLTEDSVKGYEATVSGSAQAGFTVTNIHLPETVSLSVTKVWDDADNQDGVRPGSVTVKLLADGKDAGKSLTLSESNGWKGSFADLPRFAAGKEIKYTIDEVSVPEYKVAVSGSAAEGFTLTNTHTPAVTSVSVTKVWEDADDQDGLRAETVTVHLFADGEDTGKTLTLDSKASWKGTFTDLPRYKAGKEIAYTVTEDEVSGYTVAVTGTAAEGFTLTNTHEPEVTDIAFTKVWDDADDQDGIRPAAVTVILLANGENTYKSFSLGAGNEWKGAFTDLPRYEKGKEIVYTLAEVSVEGYTVAITGSAAEGFTITNTHVPEEPDEPTPPTPPEPEVPAAPRGVYINMNEGDCFN